MQWLEQCGSWKAQWPVSADQPDYENDAAGINLYKFTQVLSAHLKTDSVVTWDAGSNLYVNNQALQLNGQQRSIGSLAQAEMGAAIGLSIGVSLARNGGEVICTVGDGSFCTQLQELSVIRHQQLPIKIFVWNNGGYLSIRNSQKNIYHGRVFGSDTSSGLFFPAIEKIAAAFEIKYTRIDSNSDLAWKVEGVLSASSPMICEVRCDPNQKIWPTSMPKDGKQVPLSDMYPFKTP